MNKKGQFSFGGVIFAMLLIVGIIVFLNILVSENNKTKTPAQLSQEAHDSLVTWHESEYKYCLSQGKDINDTYYINDCRIVECKNSTEITTYQFCSTKDNSGGAFVGGIIVGHLLFSK
jgi:hypothetical protein